MSSIILVSVVVPILITVVVLVAVFKKVGGMTNSKLLQTGMPGTAQITGLTQGSMVVNMTNYECHIAMNISLPGQAPYEAVITQLVPMIALPRVQPGSIVAVKVDQTDRTKAVIDFNAPVAVAAPGMGMGMAAPNAGAIAGAVAAGGAGSMQHGSSAALLQTGQRVRGVLMQFADTGNTPRSLGLNPSKPEYMDDPMYALTLELHIPNLAPVTAQVVHRVPRAQVPNLRMGWELNCAVNPSNPQEVAVDWGD